MSSKMPTAPQRRRVSFEGPFVVGALLCACGGEATDSIESLQEPIIYGTDDRRDYTDFNSQSIQRVWLDATPVLVRDNEGVSCDSTWCTATLQAFVLPRLCTNERFVIQDRLNGQWGTGFLIAPDRVLTAAHVLNPIVGGITCSEMRIVFDFRVNEFGVTNAVVPRSSTRRCADFTAGDLNFPPNPGADWAIIRLDAPIDRVPFIIRREGRVANGAQLAATGYPAGPYSESGPPHPAALPVKFFEGGEVQNNPPSDFEPFEFTMDFFTGNSGSPVFEMDTGLVEGIESTGSFGQSGEYFSSSDAVGPCFRATVCPDNGCADGAENAVRTTRVAQTVEVPLTAREIMTVTAPLLN